MKAKHWPGVFAKSDSACQHVQHLSVSRFVHRLHPLALSARKHAAWAGASEWDPDIHGPFDDSANEDILRGRVVRMAAANEIS